MIPTSQSVDIRLRKSLKTNSNLVTRQLAPMGIMRSRRIKIILPARYLSIPESNGNYRDNKCDLYYKQTLFIQNTFFHFLFGG